MRIRFAALALAATLAACSSDRTGGDGATGGTVLIGVPNDPPTLFPLLANEETSMAMTNILFDKLARIGPNLGSFGTDGFTPRLAKSWDWSSDSLSITFHLDPAARFHDGTPVTAADVRYSIRIAKDPQLGSPFTSQIENIDSVSVVDSLTPVFWFKRRSPTQFYDAAYQIAPVPEHVYGKIPVADLKTSEVTRTPVGSGRFRFVKWEPGVRLEVIADTTHARGRPNLDRVIFMIGQAPTASAAAVLAGEIDFFSAFPMDQLSRLDTTVVQAVPSPGNGYGFLGMNARDRKVASRAHPILSDPAVRRAISMSLDRRAMLTNVFGSAGRLAYGPFPTGADLGDTTLKAPAYDTTAAGAALDAAGWRRGADGVRMKNGRPLALEIVVPAVSIPRVRYAELIQEQLNRAGFRIEIARQAIPQFMPALEKHDFDLILLTIIVDPSVSGVQQYWTNPDAPGTSNALGYRSPAVDADLDSAGVAPTREAMRRYTMRAFQRIMDDAPAVWLYSAGTVAAAHRRIELAPFPLDGWWHSLPEWSIPADKRIDRDRVGLRPATP